MAEIAKINGVAIADIAKISGIAIGDIAALGGFDVPAGGPPILYVQADQTYEADGSAGVTVSPGSRTNGNTVFAQIVYENGATLAATPTFGGQDMVFVATRESAAGATIRIDTYARYLDGTESNNNCYAELDSAYQMCLGVAEFSGLVNASVESYEDSNRDTGATIACVTSALAPASANNLIIYGACHIGRPSDYDSGPTNGFTRLTAVGPASGGIALEWGYLIRSADNSSIASDLTLNSSYDWGSVSSAWGGN